MSANAVNGAGGEPGSPTLPGVVPGFGPRLDALVEQLWSGPLGTGRVRIGLGDDGHVDGWIDAERYRVLPSVRRATLLVPDGPRSATAGALLNYRGLRPTRRNLQRGLLGTAARAGALRAAPLLTLRVAADLAAENRPVLPLAMLAAALGLPEVHASIGIRTGANRKATLQLVDPSGRPVGFAKMAWDSASAAGVRREALALDHVTLGSAGARTPALLSTGEFYGLPWLLTAPLPPESRGVRARVLTPTAQELYTLCPLHRRAPVAHTAQFRALRDRVDDLRETTRTRGVVRATRELLRDLAALDIETPVTRRWHGDLTPWNCARDGAGSLWTWDWESSEPDAVAGLDALHWHLTVRTESGGSWDGRALGAAYQDALPAMIAAGTPQAARPAVLGVYVTTLAERACALGAGAGGWETGWVLPEQLLDLLGTARRALEA